VNATVNSQLLAVELRSLNKIVPTKPTFEILSHALVTTADDKLEFYATDLEVALSTSCAARVDAPGAVALPVAKLLQMVEQFPDADVSLTVDKAQVVVKCGGFTSRLRVLPVGDFPEPPIVVGAVSKIDAASLRGLIAKTRHAVSMTATKYVLKGALLECSGPAAAMIATEGKRLSLAMSARLDGSDLSVVVPAKALDVLAEGSDEGELTLTIGDRHMFFALNGKLLTSRKLEGQFPKWRLIVPTQNDKKIVVERNVICAALRRVILAAEENGALYVTLSPGLLELSAASVGIGSAYEPVQVSYDGPKLKILIPGEYLLDFFNSSDRETVTIELKDEKTAARLLGGGDDHVGVVMLMRP
jgi:DNA polymerase-3 subunit beta